MTNNTIRNLVGSPFSPLTFLEPRHPLNLYFIQFFAFGYLAYLLLSWDFTTIGYYPNAAYEEFHRYSINSYWDPPLYYYFPGFLFIYRWVPHLSPHGLGILQSVTAGFACLGLVGVFPRLSAWVVFVLFGHLCALYLYISRTLDGSTTIPLGMIFILGLTQSGTLYYIGKPSSWKMAPRYSWPVALYWLYIAYYYSHSGLNKGIESSWLWPLQNHLENFAKERLEQSLFISEPLNFPHTTSTFTQIFYGYISAGVGFFLELSVLFIPFLKNQYRLILAVFMAGLHVSVYLLYGYNYLFYGIAIFLCLDYSKFAETYQRGQNFSRFLRHEPA